MSQSAADFNTSIQKISEALCAAMLPLSSAFTEVAQAAAKLPVFTPDIHELIEQQCRPLADLFYQAIDWERFYDGLDQMNIASGHFEFVSMKALDNLTPDQRWEYQKWVWGAPIRWGKYLYQRVRFGGVGETTV